MKSLILKINKQLRSTQGETLVEAIVSILLLAILLTTIAAMINTSMRMTSNSMQEARLVQQGALNPAFLGETSSANIIELTITPLTLPININAKHDVQMFDSTAPEVPQNILAFYPVLNQFPPDEPGDPIEPDEPDVIVP